MLALLLFQLNYQDPGIQFKMPYTMGIHDGHATQASGQIEVDPEHPEKARGNITVPIAALKTDNDKRDCHLREALGLDYAKSGYPEEHVCDDDQKLPTQGKDAVVYPNITFKVKGIREKIALDKPSQLTIDGEWTIHGVTKPATLKMNTTPEAGGKSMHLQGEMAFLLKDYGIEVKPAKILVAKITVHEEAKASFDLVFQKK